MVRKLAQALTYISEEVIDDDRPLYGVYKAIEALTEALVPPVTKKGKKNKGLGRKALAKFAGSGEKYVGDVMQTAELTRHHNDPDARQVLTEDECRSRARLLIEAYATSGNRASPQAGHPSARASVRTASFRLPSWKPTTS